MGIALPFTRPTLRPLRETSRATSQGFTVFNSRLFKQGLDLRQAESGAFKDTLDKRALFTLADLVCSRPLSQEQVDRPDDD